MTDYRQNVIDCIPAAAADLGDHRLAYLSLTGKPELPIRDAVAWQLHRSLGDGVRVAREWRRTDIAVVTLQDRPAMLLEAKAMYTFDAVKPNGIDQYMGYLAADQQKASGLAEDETEIVLLLLVTHVADKIPPEMRRVVKYTGINSALTSYPPDELLATANERIAEGLTQFPGPVTYHPMTDGSAFGMRASVAAYVVGG